MQIQGLYFINFSLVFCWCVVIWQYSKNLEQLNLAKGNMWHNNYFKANYNIKNNIKICKKYYCVSTIYVSYIPFKQLKTNRKRGRSSTLTKLWESIKWRKKLIEIIGGHESLSHLRYLRNTKLSGTIFACDFNNFKKMSSQL